MLGALLDEHISRVETTEKSDDSLKPLSGFLLVDSLKSFPKLIVTVGGDETGSLRASVHKLLERDAALLLELRIILERLLNHLVHLCL